MTEVDSFAPKNLLRKTRTYLVGHMQYGEGRSWREDMGEFLNSRGINIFDPYAKPFVDSANEDEVTHDVMRARLAQGDLQSVHKHMKEVRAQDLRMVDRADFVIAYIDPSIPTYGTVEELVTCVRAKHPCFIVVEGGRKNVPFWLLGMFPPEAFYDSFSDLKKTISEIDNGYSRIDGTRWRLFKEEYR